LRVHYCLLLSSLVLFLVARPLDLHAQAQDCPPEPALLSATNPVYLDAMELKQTLESHGFVVHCVFPTMLGSIFRIDEGGVLRSTVEGEASFRTNYGDVDAVFMPKPQTFAGFRITEHREDGGFVYTFAGTPRVWAVNRVESAHRFYFLDRGNQLLLSNDLLLLDRLEKTLQVRHRKL